MNVEKNLKLGFVGKSFVGCGHYRHEPDLVYRLLNPLGFAAGQLAVFQGASDEHI
jgi:hypothetical protein